MYLFLSAFSVVLYVLDCLFTSKFKQMATSKLMSVPLPELSEEHLKARSRCVTLKSGFAVPSEAKNLYFKSEVYLTALNPFEEFQVKGPMASHKLIMNMQKFRKIINQINSLMGLDDFKEGEGQSHSGYLEMDRILAIMTLKWLKHREELDKRHQPNFFKHFYNDPPKTKNKLQILRMRCIVKCMGLGKRFFSFIECDDGVTVYGTNVDYIERKIELNFWGPYKFENLPEKFRITAKIYTWNPHITPSITAVGDIIIDDKVLKGKTVQVESSSSNILKQYLKLKCLTVTLQHNEGNPVTYRIPKSGR